MSYQVPQDYPTLPSMAIPHALVGDDIKQFKGSRCVTKYLPSASGSTVGPSSSVLFTIPAEPYGYIKPNSMYLRGRVVVPLGVGWVGQTVGASTSSYMTFSGNTFCRHGAAPATAVGTASIGTSLGVGGASSLISRQTLTLPGGCSMSYNQQIHYRNAVTPHTMDASYLGDLRQSEHAGVTTLIGQIPASVGGGVQVVATTDSFDKWFSFPLDLPLLNADSAFPLLLCSQGLSLELVTSTLNEAITFVAGTLGAGVNGVAPAAPTTYRLSDLTLVYDVIMVTPEFKTALVASKAGNPYVVHVDDRMVIGPVGCTNASSTRVNVGVGLSSLKSVLFTEGNNATVSAPKVYSNNAMVSYNVYRDGQQISIPNTTTDDVAFMEMQRAIGRINDPQTTSMLQSYDPTVTVTYAAQTVPIFTNARTTYPDGGFLAGCSMQSIDDWSFSAKGVACDQLAIELIKNGAATDPVKWSTNSAGFGNSSLYIFCMYDSVCVILGDGTCQIRK